MNGREYAYILPIMLFIFWIGLNPKPFLDKTTVSVEHLLQKVNYQKTAGENAENPTTIEDEKKSIIIEDEKSIIINEDKKKEPLNHPL
jgi:NADH-quinone oxidoreductase subunit M